MRKVIILLIALAMILSIVIATGCSRENSPNEQESSLYSQPTTKKEVETTVKPTEKATEKPTEKATEKLTEKATEAPKPKEYTAEELILKSVPEILDILDYDITVECNGENSNYGGSTGSMCFYNFEKLHGFVFSPKGVIYQSPETDLDDVKDDILSGKYEDLSFVVAKNSAKVSEWLSADMTYNEISKKTGSYSTQPPAGQGLITQNLTDCLKNCSYASVTYETSREAMNHMDNNTGYDPSYLQQENPKVQYIIMYTN